MTKCVSAATYDAGENLGLDFALTTHNVGFRGGRGELKHTQRTDFGKDEKWQRRLYWDIECCFLELGHVKE